VLNRDDALARPDACMALTLAAANVRGIRAVTLVLLAATVALVVIGVVFLASSHPLRGGVLVVLAVATGVGALLSARYR
jgi:hypothetical protein